ncbi:MAG TPA: hypothetical protein VHE34_25030 [Puia sp.]|uniref:2,3-diaminopropionate biosynthesis protein SbnB n=1 Tax=Puia sp. TaxID=2045100 RepID=UPI002C8113AE|nr:2,3-diaminopropionate biosynthesis protein SbnB [Puia sp.]HVU98519.1 hypothetical protein [Puia sp.]
MLYLDESGLPDKTIAWQGIADVIESASQCIRNKDYVQPLKPYLRFGDPRNRIIAMPAFIGGMFNTAGIKWIASFPDNIHHDLPRASSVTILNDARTGIPYCIINATRLSAIRTAGVSAMILRKYLHKINPAPGSLRIGLTGAGPIGIKHIQMIETIAGDSIASIRVFDIRDIDEAAFLDNFHGKVEIAESWQEAYADADIFISCTVSSQRYIDLPPKKGSLHLNVSLRDYCISAMRHMDIIAVDDWDEVCRENTDIEQIHREGLIQRGTVLSIGQNDFDDRFAAIPHRQTIMFNPMGMAVYDIAVGRHFFEMTHVQRQLQAIPELA